MVGLMTKFKGGPVDRWAQNTGVVMNFDHMAVTHAF